MSDPSCFPGELGQREIRRFREDLDTWKSRHLELKRHWAMDDLLSQGLHYLERIKRLRALLIKDSVERETGRSNGGKAETISHIMVRRAMMQWLETSEEVLEYLSRVEEEESDPFENANAFREKIAETRAFLYSPRPVYSDDSGRLFEVSGERFITDGLEPAKVLDVQREEQSGRMRSLKDIIAARKSNAL